VGTSINNCCCPPSSNEKWDVNAFDSNGDGKDDAVAVDTGDYTVVTMDDGTVMVFDDNGTDVTAECTVWGDPHVSDSDSTVDTKGTTTIVLPDDTKVTMMTTPAGNGTTYVESVLVSDGANAVAINGAAPGGEAISYEATSTQGEDWEESWEDGVTLYLDENGQLNTPQGEAVTQQYVNGYEDATPYDESEGSQAEANHNGSDPVNSSAVDSAIDAMAEQGIEEGDPSKKKKKGKDGNSTGGAGIWEIIAAMGEKVDAQLKNVMEAIEAVDTSAESDVTAKQLAEVQVQTAKLGWFGQTWQTVGQTAAQTGEKAGSAGKPS
jgi:hypothetical protein